MSLPPRLHFDKGEFPAATVGPSIDPPSNIPASIMQGVSLTRKNGVRNLDKPLTLTTTTNFPQSKRNAPLMMAGQRQIDNTLKSKNPLSYALPNLGLNFKISMKINLTSSSLKGIVCTLMVKSTRSAGISDTLVFQVCGN